MKIILLLILITFTLIPNLVLAADQEIYLKDGTKIKGEVVGLNNGVYTIKSLTLGNLSIPASSVGRIADASWEATSSNVGGTSGTDSTHSGNMDQKIQSTQAQIMNNPQAMASIKDMMNDPELMKLLTDPGIMQAAMAHNVQAIENNPKAKELMNNPKMKAFMEQVSSKQ